VEEGGGGGRVLDRPLSTAADAGVQGMTYGGQPARCQRWQLHLS
jgi:hypothetical protein